MGYSHLGKQRINAESCGVLRCNIKPMANYNL